MFKLLLLKLSVLGLLLVPVMPMTATAQTENIDGPANIGGNLESSSCLGSADCPDDAAESVNRIIALVINIFSIIVGVVSVIMIIIGGLKYITSGGDSNNITGAKNTILYAIIGLVIVALAQVIVRFVLDRATASL